LFDSQRQTVAGVRQAVNIHGQHWADGWPWAEAPHSAFSGKKLYNELKSNFCSRGV